MTTPGSNLFLQAARLIRLTPIDYFAFTGRVKNDVFQWVSSFQKLDKPLLASVQAIQRDSYQQYGLDFQRNYVKVYAAMNLIDLERDTSGDRFIYKGKVFQLESQYTWWNEDGWDKCIAVEVGKPDASGGVGA